MPHRSFLVLAARGLAACTLASASIGCTGASADSAAPADTEAGEGTLSLRFGIDEDYAAAMTEAPTGPFYGGIFHEEDVTSLGAADGAVPIEEFLVELTLSTDGALTEPLHATGSLPAGKVYVLGYLDTDRNGPHTGPDQGDPVTNPTTDHRVEVVADGVTEAEVVLDLLMP